MLKLRANRLSLYFALTMLLVGMALKSVVALQFQRDNAQHVQAQLNVKARATFGRIEDALYRSSHASSPPSRQHGDRIFVFARWRRMLATVSLSNTSSRVAITLHR